MNHWYRDILHPYELKEYTVQLQAKYLRAVIMMIVCTIPVFLLLDIVSQQKLVPAIHFPQLAIGLVALIDLQLLRKGHLQLAGHLLVWSFLAGLWTVIYMDVGGEEVVRTDTVMITLSVLAIVPLLQMRNRIYLWLFHIANLCFFAVFCVMEHLRGQLSPFEFRDFVIDTSAALVAFAIVSNGVYTVYMRAFQRLQEEKNEVEQVRKELKQTVDGMPSLLLSIDADCRVIGWNQTVEKTMSVSYADAAGKQIFQVFPFLPSYEQIIRNVAGGAQVFSEKKLKIPALSSSCLYHLTVYPLVAGQSGGAVIRLDDITEQARIEQMMIQTEKMVSVGGLAAGMAHEINNPLAGILQNIQVLELRMTPDIPKNVQVAERFGLQLPALQKYMEERRIHDILSAVKGSSMQAAKVVSNMLSFARKENGHKLLIDPVSLMEDTLALAGNEYDLKKNYDFRKIQIQTDYEEALPSVPCIRSMIQQVLLNILRNGAQAMAQNPPQRPPAFRLTLSCTIKEVQFRITDNGPGIESHLIEKVFEPFFTTKVPGAGTGLGLSVSYFIVTETHKGKLTVESVPDTFTTFTVALPIGDPDLSVVEN